MVTNRPKVRAKIPAQTGARAEGGLTQKQEDFVLAFVEGRSAADAYRHAYRAKKMSAKTIHECASRLLADRKIAARVELLRAKAAGKAGYTLERHLARLSRLGEAAEAAGEHLAALKAEELVGKATGHQPVAGRVNVNVALPGQSEPVSETSRWLSELTGRELAGPP